MTEKQKQILAFLEANDGPATPTEIGEGCGKPYSAASSWASSGLKSLAAAGKVIRHATARYSIAKGEDQ